MAGAPNSNRVENERQLLIRCAEGDAAAFEPIVHAYRGRAYGYALTILGSHDDALDVSQEAFARAFRLLGTFDCERNFLPWFLRIVRNLAFNLLRRRRSRPQTLPGRDGAEAAQALHAGEASPAAAVEREERAATIRQALNQLPAAHREVLHLRHFEEMSYQEIADALRVPPGTVMSRLYNGRKRLARLLKEVG